MGKGTPAIVSILLFVVIAFVALKLLGALIGFAVKLLLLAVAAVLAGVVYLAIRKQIGGSRAP